MPPLLITLLPAIQAAIAAAPGALADIEQVIAAAKQFITGLFSSGLITADLQNSLHAFVDQQAAAVKAGQLPPSWIVMPDPPSGVAPPAAAPASSSPAGTPSEPTPAPSSSGTQTGSSSGLFSKGAGTGASS